MKGSIMLSGGGSTKLFAAIGVTYPAGSTLTCTNGSKTLTAKTTSGQWVFAIPEAGTWTVTATNGTDTKSQSVSITKEGQIERVTLSYRLNLYEEGNQCSDITGGWTGNGYTATAQAIKSASFAADHIEFYGTQYYKTIGGTENLINVSQYGYLCVDLDVKSWSGAGNALDIGMYSQKADFPSTVQGVKGTNILGRQTLKLDISSITEGYILIHADGYATNKSDVYNVWLE